MRAFKGFGFGMFMGLAAGAAGFGAYRAYREGRLPAELEPACRRVLIMKDDLVQTAREGVYDVSALLTAGREVALERVGEYREQAETLRERLVEDVRVAGVVAAANARGFAREARQRSEAVKREAPAVKPAEKAPKARVRTAAAKTTESTAAKKPTVKKPTVKKPTVKKPTVKKPAARKPTIKKPAIPQD